MRRLIALTSALVLALALVACSDDDSDNDSGANGSPSDQITIENFAFQGATVAAGATVTVQNDDSTAHTVAADDDAFDTGNVSGGETATFTAPSEAGDYPYHCNIHSNMRGTLTVT
jgi:plastocyanin